LKEKTYRTIMIVGLYLGLLLFVLAIISLAKNIREIKTDPIIYGMENNGFVSCACTTQDGRYTNILLKDYSDISVNKLNGTG